MKVLHLISTAGFYGAERVAVELAKGLVRRGGHAELALLVPDPGISRETVRAAQDCGVAARVFPCRRRFSLRVIRELRRWIREGAFEVVHSHGYKSNFYALAATLGAVPLVATNHNWLKHHWRLAVYSVIDKALIRCFDRIVAVSDPIRDEMIGAGIPRRKIQVIDNGVDVEAIAGRTRGNGSGDAPRRNGSMRIVGAIGSLKEEKGFRYLLDAVPRVVKTVGNIRFVIVGEGPLRGELERRIESQNLEENVLLTGYRSDVYDLLGTFDLFVLPSVREGLPMVLLEGMAAGKPIVATRVGAVPRVVDDGVNGVLVEPGDSDGLAAAIERIFAEPERARDMAERGRITVREEFSSDSMFSKYHAIYAELTGRGRS